MGYPVFAKNQTMSIFHIRFYCFTSITQQINPLEYMIYNQRCPVSVCFMLFHNPERWSVSSFAAQWQYDCMVCGIASLQPFCMQRSWLLLVNRLRGTFVTLLVVLWFWCYFRGKGVLNALQFRGNVRIYGCFLLILARANAYLTEA